MEPLFSKPMNELREAFVRARFAEPAMFGRPDIEEWQSAPGFNTIPFDRAPGFPRHFNRIWEGTNLSWVLRTKATPLTEPPDWHLFRMKNKGGNPDAYVAIIRAWQMGGAHIYYPWNNTLGLPPVLLIDNEIYAIDLPYDQFKPILSLRRASVGTVLEVLNGEITHGRPKTNEARMLFRTEAGNAIAVVRQDAQSDFDEAVAVSADGTKIVKADWVVVIKDDFKSMHDFAFGGHAFPPLDFAVFRGEKFHQNKILVKEETLERSVHKWGPLDDRISPLKILSVARSHYAGAIRNHVPLGPFKQMALVKHDGYLGTTAPTVLVVLAKHCPSPLPQDGWEIRV